MGQAERSEITPDGQVTGFDDESAIAAQAAAVYRSRGVPSDWFVDPADPSAAERYRAAEENSLEDTATAFLAAHEALAGSEQSSTEIWAAEPELDLSKSSQSQAIWIGLPGIAVGDPADEGELGWQADALCAQTDPEAFFPEKGGSTRDAKKVCGSCNVRSQCLEYALSNDERFGIWGGLSERERRRLRKRAV
ncbi:WhiB family transcriptional regulator [Psychromicrobium lacuslunae]|uniref:WhiB family transcriptional regulator n=1 Tax=Psychromicrobium lacuslunae TaxID=1618207 RepID=UPI0009E56452|nr:WhiB family transcriptional regulator [Psychromicrobium lacuslunae]